MEVSTRHELAEHQHTWELEVELPDKDIFEWQMRSWFDWLEVFVYHILTEGTRGKLNDLYSFGS